MAYGKHFSYMVYGKKIYMTYDKKNLYDKKKKKKKKIK